MAGGYSLASVRVPPIRLCQKQSSDTMFLLLYTQMETTGTAANDFSGLLGVESAHFCPLLTKPCTPLIRQCQVSDSSCESSYSNTIP